MFRRYGIGPKDYAITISIGLILGVIFGPIIGSKLVSYFTFWWWVFQGFSIFVTVYSTHLVYQALFIPAFPKPNVPELVSAFDEAIRKASYNFCAVSSKEIALWQSQTFTYYLTLNDIKNILEYNSKYQRIQFSTHPDHKGAFYQEGLVIAKRIASGEIYPEFFGLRLVIYPEEVYNSFTAEVLSLIQLHAIARVHCIPLVREKLVQQLNDEERSSLGDFARRLRQDIKEEYTATTGAQRLARTFRRLKPADPYSISIPDFLIINMNPSVRAREQVWWYKGNTPDRSTTEPVVTNAERCYRILCSKVAPGTLWSQYTAEIFSTVPIGEPSLQARAFFSEGYFYKWIKEVVPEYPALQRWVERENEVLSRFMDSSDKIERALDIGCGWGRHLELMLSKGVKHAAGIDSNPVMIRRCSDLLRKYPDRVSVRLEDAQDMTYKDNEFDFVICMTNTFGNLGNDGIRRKALREIVRVLKPGGTFILSIYNDSQKAVRSRMESYLQVGLHPFALKNGKIIETKEGLISEQFSATEITNYLRREFKDVAIETVNDYALIATARNEGH